MKNTKRFIPQPILNRAESLGEPGLQWLAELDDLIRHLEEKWNITVGDALSGGTHAFVAPATRHTTDTESHGTTDASCILKIHLPEEYGAPEFEREMATLQIANGNGYAKLYELDREHHACLMERLGKPLADTGYPVIEQIRILCQAMKQAWQIPVTNEMRSLLSDGQESITWFRDYIRTTYEAHPEVCSPDVITQAMHFLDSREADFHPEEYVMVHGDVHATNAMQDLSQSDNSEALGFKLVDADGIFYEKAYDLGVLMREWREDYLPESEEIKPTDLLQKGIARCTYLSELTGVDTQAIWEWGYLQCVSTGLITIDILPEESKKLLALAEAWCHVEVVHSQKTT